MTNVFNLVGAGLFLAGFCGFNLADNTVTDSCIDLECCDKTMAMYDLSKGTYAPQQPKGIELVRPLQKRMYGDKDCSYSGLLKVSFEGVTEKPYNICMSTPWWGRHMVKLELFFHSYNRSGRVFNIGDSSSNDGNGGDASTQAYDAEMDGNYPGVYIYKNDICLHEKGYPHMLGQYPNSLALEVPSMTVYIANEYIRIKYGQHDHTVCSKCVFGLNNYPDTNPNNDIYVAFNSVVSDGYRYGYGLCSVKASWVCPESQ